MAADIENFKAALESRRSNLEKNLPTCRVCGQRMKLLDDEAQKWYCFKDDEVWFGKEQRWEEQVERPTKEQIQSVKYCKKCGNMLQLEDEFCDRCGSGQKKILATVSTNPQSATASTDGQQTMFLDKPQIKPTGLWYLAPFFFGIIGGLIGYAAVKDDDKGMAENLLIFGVVMTVLLFFVTLAIV
jgi:hypothetical protein